MSACNENTVRCESRPGGACCLDHLFNLLVELDDVCVSLDLPYVLAFGSLLGSVRERDIIPHDTDADVIMMQGDFDKLMENKHLIKRPIKRTESWIYIECF